MEQCVQNIFTIEPIPVSYRSWSCGICDTSSPSEKNSITAGPPAINPRQMEFGLRIHFREVPADSRNKKRSDNARSAQEKELTENLVSDCFGNDEWKALAKAARQRDDLA